MNLSHTSAGTRHNKNEQTATLILWNECTLEFFEKTTEDTCKTNIARDDYGLTVDRIKSDLHCTV